MKKSAVRAACAGLLMLIAVAVSVGTIGAVFSDNEEQSPEEKAPAKSWARVAMLGKEEVQNLCLYDSTGSPLQKLTTDENGRAVSGLLEAGSYFAVTPAGCTAFTLKENASVAVTGGCGWSDGEILHLTSEQVGNVTVVCAVTDEQVKTGWLDLVLTDGTLRRREVVYCREAGETVQCSFSGIPYGSYRLEESGSVLCNVDVSAETPELQISLP